MVVSSMRSNTGATPRGIIRSSGEAEFAIGRLYRRGEGVFANFAEAAHWFEKASQRGHAEAKLELAKLLFWGATDQDIQRLRCVAT
jgi:TPR repeat protein